MKNVNEKEDASLPFLFVATDVLFPISLRLGVRFRILDEIIATNHDVHQHNNSATRNRELIVL
jgi:hypothetical protein